MVKLFLYRVFCETDGIYEYEWGETEPTTCRTNSLHTINPELTTITRTLNTNEVVIQVEAIPTGGHFQAITLRVDVSANSTNSSHMYRRYPISPAKLTLNALPEHIGDIFSLIVGKDTIVGALTADAEPATPWDSKTSYTVGNNVIYDGETYSCTADTSGQFESSSWVDG